MKSYIGTKVVHAKPMTRLEYNTHRGWAVPEDENGADEGYLVEYVAGGSANHKDHKGYISWSPKDVFEHAYHPTTNMRFGDAIEAAKQGERIARAGWNGKDMWVAYSPGNPVTPAGQFWSQANAAYAHSQPGHHVAVLPCFTMKTATGEILMGWLASQTDMLADDWTIV